MKIRVIGVMDQKVKILKEKLTDTISWEQTGALFVSGSLGRHKATMVRSGIGKVASTVTMVLLIHQRSINVVINTGSAGGIDEGLRVGDLVIIDKLVYFNVDVTGFDYTYEQLPGGVPLYFRTSEYLRMEVVKAAEKTGLAVRKGLIVAGDTFVDSAEKVAKIKKELPEALTYEMEGAAIGQTTSQFNIPFLVVRTISDTADGETTRSFDRFIGEAGEKSAEMVIHFVENLV